MTNELLKYSIILQIAFSVFDALSEWDTWVCKMRSSSGRDSLNDADFLFLKGDYEGENVEPNDRKVSCCKGGLTYSQESQPEVSPVGIWTFAKISQKIPQKGTKCQAVEVQKYFPVFKFARIWNAVWICINYQAR